MSARPARIACTPGAVAPAPAPAARVALLGAGTVGRAVLERLACWQAGPWAGRLALVHAANSRLALQRANGLDADDVLHCLAGSARDASTPVASERSKQAGDAAARYRSELDQVAPALTGAGVRIVIDATASEAVTARHADWLSRGIHVVTACKLGQGGGLAQWQAIRSACRQGEARYGDSATVGAGLPLLRSIRDLQDGGDRIHAIAGVLSGSLAWLFNHYDGLRPFSGFVREARAAGFTEPDPRDDLSGEDVRRKLLILARAAGVALEPRDVEVASLVPASLAGLPLQALDAALTQLDAPMRERFAQAYRSGEKLRFVARLDVGQCIARVGLESLAPDHPLAAGAGTDNRVAIWSDRYDAQPLVIQGPGAGAQVTAAALLDDALRLATLAV